MPGKFKFNKRPDSKVQKQQPVEQPKEFADAEEVEEAENALCPEEGMMCCLRVTTPKPTLPPTMNLI